MPNWIKTVLLALSCLLTATCPANSQALRPLRPHVVRLGSGAVARRPLVGVDTATYRALRVNAALDQQQLAERAAQLRQWRELHHHGSLATVQEAKELHATRTDNAALNVDLTKQIERTNKALALPRRPPLLFDGRFYAGASVGAVVLTALKLLLLH